MSKSLGEALPEGIAKVSEWLGQQDAKAKEYDAMSPGMGDGTRFVASVVRVKRDAALAAQQSGDVIAMIAAYQELKPALDLATAEQKGPHMMIDVSNDAYIARVAICEAAMMIADRTTAPHVLYKPSLQPDGDKWCALLGADLMDGVAGFGDTPSNAMAAFDDAWRSSRTPSAMVAVNTK